MTASTVLARGRAAAQRNMQDACVIKRRTGEVTDPASGVITPTHSTLYTGICRVQQRSVSASQADAGEAYALMLRLEIQLPMSVTGLRAEDEVTITASEHDVDLVNRVFLIRELAHGTHKTARRIGVQERTS